MSGPSARPTRSIFRALKHILRAPEHEGVKPIQLRARTLNANDGGTPDVGDAKMRENRVTGMVERAARAVCALRSMDPDGVAVDVIPAVKTWRTFIPLVETVLQATTLPTIPVLEGGAPEGHPALTDWALYRKTFGMAGAKAREPTLHAFTGWHVTAAWRTWNGMVEAALKYPEGQEDRSKPASDELTSMVADP